MEQLQRSPLSMGSSDSKENFTAPQWQLPLYVVIPFTYTILKQNLRQIDAEPGRIFHPANQNKKCQLTHRLMAENGRLVLPALTQ